MLEYVKIDNLKDDEPVMFCAEEQYWDDATLKQLKEEYNVIFMTGGEGVNPVMIVDKGNGKFHHFLFVIGSEDDGCIQFERAYGQFKNSFHYVWAKYLIADLQEAMKICEKQLP